MSTSLNLQSLTPQKIVLELDKYIIGQSDAKKNVAIALRNRWRRMNVREDFRKEINPNNILMIGPTGVGKTEIARRLASLSGAPFIKVEASKFTEVGYVGRDVESMVRDLVEQAIKIQKSQKKEELKEQTISIVNEKLLDLLLPATTVPQSEEEKQLFDATKARLKEKLLNGHLENSQVEIEKGSSSGGPDQIFGGVNLFDQEAISQLTDVLGKLNSSSKGRKIKVPISEARSYLLEEELNKLVDNEDLIDEALKKAENLGIIFIDEIDKIAKNANNSGADVSREGVQRDLLPIVEGSAVKTRYGMIKTDHILFIAAGAFHVSKPSDLIPELQGRFPIRVELNSLNEEDFFRILSEPQNALTKQYIELIATEGVRISFDDEALKEIAKVAYSLNQTVENIGARRLQTVLSLLLNEFLYDIPEVLQPGGSVTITKEIVQQKLSTVSKDPDLSRYIL